MPRTRGLRCAGRQAGFPLYYQIVTGLHGSDLTAAAQFARRRLVRLTRAVTIVTSGPATIMDNVALPAGRGKIAEKVKVHLLHPGCLRHLLTEACESLIGWIRSTVYATPPNSPKAKGETIACANPASTVTHLQDST